MKIDVKVRKIITEPGSKVKGIFSLTLDDAIAVHDVKLVAGTNGDFISFPSRQMKDGEYKDIIHPITSDMRKQIHDAVTEAYDNAEDVE